MAHFAKIENNIVVEVLVVHNDLEHRGADFLANDLGLGGTWIQTSYNNNFRKQYAGIGYTYDAVNDVFTGSADVVGIVIVADVRDMADAVTTLEDCIETTGLVEIGGMNVRLGDASAGEAAILSAIAILEPSPPGPALAYAYANANANASVSFSGSRGAATVRFATIGTPASFGTGRANGPAKPVSRTGSAGHNNCRRCACQRTAKSADGATAARRRRFSRPEQLGEAHQHRCTAPDSRASGHSNYPAPYCCFGCRAANTGTCRVGIKSVQATDSCGANHLCAAANRAAHQKCRLPAK